MACLVHIFFRWCFYSHDLHNLLSQANLGLAALASGSLVGGATYPSTSIAVNGAPGVTQELVIQSTEHLVREAGWYATFFSYSLISWC